MTDILVPKLNSNDTAYLVVAWLAADGRAVRAGEAIVELETSKTVEELTAEHDGVLRHALAEGAECAPGQVIARLSLGEEPAPGVASPAAAEGERAATVVITRPAQALMAERGITLEEVHALGKKVVTTDDLDPDLIHLSRTQRRVAAVVEESHAAIPAAFTAMRVDVTDALSHARVLSRRDRVLIGVPELVVKAAGSLVEKFPLCFATPVSGRSARRAGAAHVGVTVDLGNGMFVPVLRDATGRPTAELAADLARYRRTALNGTFTEADLSGANILLALHPDDGVILATPIVYPGHTCALSLTAPRQETDGRRVVTLGLAYDHRFLNGRDAAAFLGALAAALRAPITLS
ncbi:2-oxo acid dehydrogenase subunit E2 [Nonomuraea soli]|uniref:Dihydrolipoamide acetyltransferase component of pyruvate dehydrogenase complex n=1 Tax=Nonomuraea soli TaxID=1032476 RepID=A0A7W0CG53_9ACTN|nr:2-oxo acid dehydrogenase subunit E2 [Nonomuraea soli]MBA2890554.1 2-oxoglutarate dehydrogenase E2 component (dihydrolipoamide succinyltransferase) [Nonomuraea soli]